jgi:hypothetical protein
MATQLLPQTARTRGVPPVGATSWRTRPLTRERLATDVARLAGRHDVLTFLRRCMPMGRGTIDLLTVGPGGVTVVGALLVRGTTLTIARAGGGFAEPRSTRLLAGERDHTAAADVVERQVTAVRHALAADGGGVPPVRGALCLPDAIDLPAFASLRLHEVVIDGPQAIAYLAARTGELTPEQVLRTARRLERAFPRR